MLSLQVSKKFGPDAAEELAALLGGMPDPDRISEAASAVIECATAEEFLTRVRGGSPA